MVRKFVYVSILVAMCLAAVSCRKLEDARKPTGPLTYETVKFTDAIPQEYGPLIAVNQNPTDVRWVGLWFQKPDGTITVVSVNTHDGRLGDKVLKIPRK